MVLVWIGIAIGVLAAIILVLRAIKTPPNDVIGMDMFCRKCGVKTNGLECPRCKKGTQSFGV